MSADRLSLWRRSGNVMVPASADARSAMERVADGERLWMRVERSRSLRQHRLFWALLTHVAEATEHESAERLLVALKIRLGWFDIMRIPGRRDPVPVPKSISFAATKQDDFQRFFDDSVRIICEEILPGTNSEELVAEIEGMLGPEPITGRVA